MFITKIILKCLLLHTVTPLEDFISKHFSEKTIVVISSNFDNFKEKMTFILHLTQCKSIINPKNAPNLEQFNYYILGESNLNTLSSSINLLKYKINTRGKFLIIMQNNLTEDDTKVIFQNLWRFYIYNVVVYSNQSSFSTWYPYHITSQCGSVVNLVTIRLINPYKDKIPKYLRACPFNVTWDKMALAIKNPFNKADPGYSLRILDATAMLVNIKLIYLTDNVKYATPSKYGIQPLIDHMTEKNIDFAPLVLPTSAPTAPQLELTIAYQNIYCYFVLPPRRKIISSTQTLAIFSKDIWCLILTSVLLMAMICKALLKKSLQTSVLLIIELILRCSLRIVPENILKRMVFGFFLLYVTNLNWIYISQLSGILSKPSYEPKILTLKALAQSNKKLKYADNWKHYFIGRGVYENIIHLRIEALENVPFHKELEDFVHSLNYGVITSDPRLLFIKNYEKLNLVSNEQVTRLESYIMVKRGLPFLDKMNDALLRIIESGFVSKWIYESQVNINKTFVSDYEETEGRFDLERFFSAIVLLGAGFLISFFVFLLELTF